MLGVSAQKLSDHMGAPMTRGVIANIESGRKKEITFTEVIALSRALGVKPHELVPELADFYPTSEVGPHD